MNLYEHERPGVSRGFLTALAWSVPVSVAMWAAIIFFAKRVLS